MRWREKKSSYANSISITRANQNEPQISKNAFIEHSNQHHPPPPLSQLQHSTISRGKKLNESMVILQNVDKKGFGTPLWNETFSKRKKKRKCIYACFHSSSIRSASSAHSLFIHNIIATTSECWWMRLCACVDKNAMFLQLCCGLAEEEWRKDRGGGGGEGRR